MNGMFRKKKNIDLWKKLDKLAVAFEIEWNWVKGLTEILIMRDAIPFAKKQ